MNEPIKHKELSDYFKIKDFENPILESQDKDGRYRFGWACCFCGDSERPGGTGGSYTKSIEISVATNNLRTHALKCKKYIECLEFRKRFNEDPEFAAACEKEFLETYKKKKQN